MTVEFFKAEWFAPSERYTPSELAKYCNHILTERGTRVYSCDGNKHWQTEKDLHVHLRVGQGSFAAESTHTALLIDVREIRKETAKVARDYIALNADLRAENAQLRFRCRELLKQLDRADKAVQIIERARKVLQR